MRGVFFGFLIASCASSAAAQTLDYPSDYLTEEERLPFRICRAAVLIEASASETELAVLPPEVISAMREQITFIMSETIYSVPAISLADGRKRVEFTEQFVIDFSRAIGSAKVELSDPKERGRTLIECQPILWGIMKQQIDVLMKWRLRALGLDRPFPIDQGPVKENP